MRMCVVNYFFFLLTEVRGERGDSELGANLFPQCYASSPSSVSEQALENSKIEYKVYRSDLIVDAAI